MATVTSFEGLERPGKSELRQFAELFVPLYRSSSEEARRIAVAALSQCRTLPPVVSTFLASQPIAVAAPFLIASPALDDDQLIAIARTHGADHARAIAARADLSVRVVDALVSLRGERVSTPAAGPAGDQPDAAAGRADDMARQVIDPAPLDAAAAIVSLPERRENLRLAAEEALRADLKARVLFERPSAIAAAEDKAMSEALLVRFARERSAREFALVLADALDSSLWLTHRILMDLSGEQLAATLVAIGLSADDCAFVITRFYPHVAREAAAAMIARHDRETSRARIAAWIRADDYTTRMTTRPEPAQPVAGNANAEPALRPSTRTATRTAHRTKARTTSRHRA